MYSLRTPEDSKPNDCFADFMPVALSTPITASQSYEYKLQLIFFRSGISTTSRRA